MAVSDVHAFVREMKSSHCMPEKFIYKRSDLHFISIFSIMLDFKIPSMENEL